MSEARVHWHYTCPICEKGFPYAFTAGRPIRKCKECKAQIKEMVKSTGGGYY